MAISSLQMLLFFIFNLDHFGQDFIPIQELMGRQWSKIDFNIGIKHGFPCINVCQVPREMLKTEAVGRGFQHLPRDLANVNVLENHV